MDKDRNPRKTDDEVGRPSNEDVTNMADDDEFEDDDEVEENDEEEDLES